MSVYTGCNEKIEPVKCLKKCILDQKVKKYIFNVFKKLSVIAKIADLLAHLGC